MDFEPAITELEIALDTMRTNEPINRKEGNIKQANLEKENAVSYRAAIKTLSETELRKGMTRRKPIKSAKPQSKYPSLAK